MIILGLDPGTATTGFGVIKKVKNHWQALAFGVITTDKQWRPEDRLAAACKDLSHLIRQHRPAYAGVEKLFFTTNQKTAMAVAQARGALLLTLTQAHVPILEFTPLEVKSMLSGYGKASKAQIQYMVKVSLGLAWLPKPDDAADALGIALCTAWQLDKNLHLG